MYTKKKFVLADNRHIKYELYKNGEQLSYRIFLKYLQEDAAFRSFFINLLGSIPFSAYQWETPAVSSSNITQPFEFVVGKSDGIDIPPDYTPFEQYFTTYGCEVAVFNNLRNDAMLVAPAPVDEELNYAHIGVFTDQAPAEQQHIFWQTVGRVTTAQISDQPLWLNTAGGGVAWLHMRLDSQPKYYQHYPYCR